MSEILQGLCGGRCAGTPKTFQAHHTDPTEPMKPQVAVYKGQAALYFCVKSAQSNGGQALWKAVQLGGRQFF